MQPLDEQTFIAFESAMETVAGSMEEVELPEAGPMYEEFVENMRGHAILYLLIDGAPQRFFQDLIVSAYAWRQYLQRCATAGYRDYCTALSRFAAFFDAIAADHLALASELLELGPRDWMKGDEYQEDFIWVRFLGVFASQGNAAGAELDGLLTRFEKALQGVPSGRLAVCQALRAQDAEAFELAFEDLIADWQAECADLRFRAEEEPLVAAATQIFVEGLAVLRLAQRVGIAPERPFPGCPPLARRKPSAPPIEDPFAP